MRIYGRLNRYIEMFLAFLRTIHGRLGLIRKIKKAPGRVKGTNVVIGKINQTLLYQGLQWSKKEICSNREYKVIIFL